MAGLFVGTVAGHFPNTASSGQTVPRFCQRLDSQGEQFIRTKSATVNNVWRLDDRDTTFCIIVPTLEIRGLRDAELGLQIRSKVAPPLWLLLRLQPDHHETRIAFCSTKQDLVALLDALEEVAVGGLEHHGQAGHFKVF